MHFSNALLVFNPPRVYRHSSADIKLPGCASSTSADYFRHVFRNDIFVFTGPKTLLLAPIHTNVFSVISYSTLPMRVLKDM